MTKIALIGAGSLVFARSLCNDILSTPALRDSTLALVDIDPRRLEQARVMVEELARFQGVTPRVDASLDRRAMLRGADYVFTTFQQGGLRAFELDIEIPQRYGVEQCVGDTLGPGGVFRGLRTIPVLLDICRELDEVAPRALLLNYVNPMAMNCWAIDRGSGRPHVGLCHSVQGTSELLAQWLNVPYAEVTYRCAGINHQAFFLEYRRGEQDLYPDLRARVCEPATRAQDPIRIALLEHFGYFVTESSGHASEYYPYFRKTARMVADEVVPAFDLAASDWFDQGRTGGYLRECLRRLEVAGADPAGLDEDDGFVMGQRGPEYGSYIIEAIETRSPIRINGNVPNRGAISNLPAGCCVEVPCLVDGNGIQPTTVGALPPQLAALMRASIVVQELAVEAALTGNREALHHAVLLDPLTAAACTLPQIHRMVDELLAAEIEWLPQFAA